jgi:hypothetical protein
MGPVDIRFSEIDAAATTQIFSEPVKQSLQHTVFDPTLKPSVTCLIGRISTRQIGPRCAGAQNPQHTVENRPWMRERPTTISAAPDSLISRNEVFDRLPLLVGEVHLDV